MKPEPGLCRAAFPRWFYNYKTGNCETFTYGGCGGNDNNYNSKESCIATCTGKLHTCLCLRRWVAHLSVPVADVLLFQAHSTAMVKIAMRGQQVSFKPGSVCSWQDFHNIESPVWNWSSSLGLQPSSSSSLWQSSLLCCWWRSSSCLWDVVVALDVCLLSGKVTCWCVTPVSVLYLHCKAFQN